MYDLGLKELREYRSETTCPGDFDSFWETTLSETRQFLLDASFMRSGHDVTVFNRTRAKADEIVALGARAAATVAEACQGEAVMTMLAGEPCDRSGT
ncbi:acetylxylan esterase [Rhizobium tibeticum]|uniref:acetylxylan esterase n=1 Tax=Rhizobium tibeticum TaxID=501024 RepID=UPI0027D89305|nr:acetylxylan esterase [Rhizobium tibeticum]